MSAFHATLYLTALCTPHLLQLSLPFALPNPQANRVTDKLTHIHDRIYCCRSGSAADTQAVADAVHQHCQVYTSVYGHAPPVATVAGLFERLCYENKDQLSAGIIVAGWDEDGGGVFNVPLGGGVFQQPWAIGGEW